MSVIKPDQLCKVLEGSYSPDAEVRGQAEVFLKSVGEKKGKKKSSSLSVQSFLQVEAPVRTAASVTLKNEVRQHWEEPGVSAELSSTSPAEVYGEEEKTVLRNSLYPMIKSMGADAAPVRLQLIECLRIIAVHDYPAKWPTLLEEVCADLHADSTACNFFTALSVLRKLVGIYEFKGRGSRQALDLIIDRTWPLLLPIVARLLKEGGPDNADAMTLLKLALKCYWSCTQLCLSNSPLVVSTMDSWFELLSACLLLPVPASMMGGLSAEERSQLPVFKAKKWALQIVQRVFTRFGDQKMLKRERGGDKDEDAVAKEFGKHFVDHWSGRLTEQLVLLLQQHTQQEVWLSPRMLNLALQYLALAVESASLYKPIIKPQGAFLVFQLCLPLMHYSSEDVETWEAEPVEYIRRQSDPLEAFSQPREAAIEFVKSLVRYRAKDFLEPMYMTVHRVCVEYQQAVQNNCLTEAVCQAKDGVLVLAGALCERLASKKRQAPIEGMLSSFVLPDLSSPNRFLRMRACWVYEVYLGSVRCWKEEAPLVEAYNRMLALLGDPELPVRVQAGVSIKAFFQVEVAALQQAIVPNLKWLAERLFMLMQDIDHDQLVTTLEQLVVSFEEHVEPLAKDLVRALTAALVAMLDREGVAQQSKDEDAEEDAAFACIAVISTLKTVLGAVTGTPHVYDEILPDLLPTLDALITPEGVDHLEDALDILAYLTFYLKPPFPPKLWSYFDAMYQAVCGGSTPSRPLPEALADGWAADHLEQMLPVIANLLGRDPETFAAGKIETGLSYPECVVLMARLCVQDSEEVEACTGLQLLSVLLLGSAPRRSVDQLLEPMLQVVWAWVQKAQREEQPISKVTKRAFILFVSSLFVYGLEPAVELLQKLQILDPVLSFVFENANLVETCDQRKTFVLAFAPLLRAVAAAPAQWPSWLGCHLDTLVPTLASHGIALREMREKKNEEGQGESEYGSDVDSEQSLDETQDAGLHAQAQSILQQLEGDWGDDDDEDWEADLDSDAEDLCYNPLEAVDELNVLREALASLPPEAAQQVKLSLGPEGLDKLAAEWKASVSVACVLAVQPLHMQLFLQ
ncbi:hypothetical protein Esti_002956 [Eimeria stiedai]